MIKVFTHTFEQLKILSILTPDRYDSENCPRGPLGQVLDEDERHERRDEDEVGLLQPQRALPVDHDHAHHAEVPHPEHKRYVVHWYIVSS